MVPFVFEKSAIAMYRRELAFAFSIFFSPNRKALRRSCQARRRPLFTIGLGDDGDANDIDEDALRAIAEQTGGLYYYAPTSDDLLAIYEAISGTIKNQYLVTYETTICDNNGTDEAEHKLEIAVNLGMAYGQDAKRFHCPSQCDPNTVFDGSLEGN